MTWTFFNFAWRFELLGVDFISWLMVELVIGLLFIITTEVTVDTIFLITCTFNLSCYFSYTENWKCWEAEHVQCLFKYWTSEFCGQAFVDSYSQWELRNQWSTVACQSWKATRWKLFWTSVMPILISSDSIQQFVL